MLLKLEILKTGTNRIYDYCKKEEIDSYFLDRCIRRELEELNLQDEEYQRLNERKLFLESKDLSPILEEYNSHLINLGRQVKVLDPQHEFTGEALGIAKSGELLVKKENKEVVKVYAGEVSVRGIYGYV